MKASCHRAFEAEAARDGRLGDAERTSFERHKRTCAACEQEARALDVLALALRADDQAICDELHVRRERTRLLAAFDRELVRPAPNPNLRRWGFAAFTLGTLAAIFFYVFFGTRPDAERQESLSSAVVRADDAAVWSKRVEDGRETVILERGTLAIRVTHAAGRSPILVALPDGEIEDIGTTFTVSAQNGRTSRVAVQEGSVVLRIHGRPVVTLGAGETWMSDPSPSMPSPAEGSAELPASSTTASASGKDLVARRPPHSNTPARADTSAGAEASAEFRSAMAALSEGDHTRAAEAFARFVSDHPTDSRAEDASYLRVIALQRAGDLEAMKTAASDYLHRYPRGFRRVDVEPLSR